MEATDSIANAPLGDDEALKTEIEKNQESSQQQSSAVAESGDPVASSSSDLAPVNTNTSVPVAAAVDASEPSSSSVPSTVPVSGSETSEAVPSTSAAPDNVDAVMTATSADPASSSTSSAAPSPPPNPAAATSGSAPVASTSAAVTAASNASTKVNGRPQTNIFLPSAPKPVAPKSRIEQLNARIRRDTRDSDARLALIADATSKGDLERAREAYEDLLRVFPDAADQWVAYADLELQHGNFANVEAIFARVLRTSTSVRLWKFYLDYIRRVNPIDVSDSQSARESKGVIAKSYEFALAHIGQDRESGEVWLSFINFLKEGQNRGTVEDQQRLDAVRKTYQRAVCVPVYNVESIWQEYNAFENGLNKMTAKKFVSELSPSYMTARKALRELKAQFDNLPTPSIPAQPNWAHREDRQAVDQWKRYFAWEEANPLEFEDTSALQHRVTYAYKKATAHLRFFTEIWFLASQYQGKIGKQDEARTLLRTGLGANPTSLLLASALADLEEAKQDYPAVYKIYDNLIELFKTRFAEIDSAIEKEIENAVEAYDQQNEQEAQDEAKGDDERDETVQKRTQEKEQIKASIRAKRADDIDDIKQSAASVWIAEMRFARRAEGVKQARSVFSRARKAPHLAWQVVEASALMELHWNNDVKVATNVFELGLKLFPTDVEFVLHYLDFLISSNNPNNARALFEKTVTSIEPAKARPIWERMARYEYQFGDFLAAQKIDQRFAEAFPDVPLVDRFVFRHSYDGIDQGLRAELGRDGLAAGRDETSGSRRTGRKRQQQQQQDGRYASRSPSPASAALPPNVIASKSQRGSAASKRILPDETKPTAVERTGAFAGVATSDTKRMKPDGGASPLPASGGPSVRVGAGKRGASGAFDDVADSRRGTPPMAGGPGGPPSMLFRLDRAGTAAAVLPEPVVAFLSALPTVSSFNGPSLNPMTIVELLQNANLPLPGMGQRPPQQTRRW